MSDLVALLACWTVTVAILALLRAEAAGWETREAARLRDRQTAWTLF